MASVSGSTVPRGTLTATQPLAQILLQQLLASSFILPEEWEELVPEVKHALFQCTEKASLLALLREHGLVNDYQAARLEAGTEHGLVLGNYRVLDRLGAGGMGVVFKAEHVRLRRVCAVKVLPARRDQDPRLLARFVAEVRAVAQLAHPNIVAAIDAGEAPGADPDAPVLHYFVMEYVPGEDLEGYVERAGPMPVAKACDVAHQLAGALAEAHRHGLVHRDVKPSNVRLTPEQQAKLLDFGLTRDFGRRHTEPGTLLGTLDYMAPEQAQDASTVDIRADLYGLGGVLFWCLTGQSPFPPGGSLAEAVTRRLTQPPPSVRARRPEVPAELEAVVARLMALKPADRYATPDAVMHALLPFIRPEPREHFLQPARAGGDTAEAATEGATTHRVLVVDDDSLIRAFCKRALGADGYQIDEAQDGADALAAAAAKPPDLVLLDIDMPIMSGREVLRRLREAPPGLHLKVIMFSGRATADEMAQMLLAGADNYLTKPFSVVQLRGQVRAALRLKEAQHRADVLNQQLLALNAELERDLTARAGDLLEARNGLVLALARLVEHRAGEAGSHALRMQRYCRRLAEAAATLPAFAGRIDPAFTRLLECCAPLHDVGKVGLPDHILLKPGKLTAEERLLMQAHTTIGADALRAVAAGHGASLAFLQMAADIARHHHERYDGTGYPDRLAGDAIPLAARLVAVADVYDALRSRRVYKPALSHASAVQIITEGSPGHFDPALAAAFAGCAADFERVFRELPD